MSELSITELEPILIKFKQLQACVSDIETEAGISFAGQNITIPAGDIAQGKIDTNALLAEIKVDLDNLTDIS